jgi:hypothetical protein
MRQKTKYWLEPPTGKGPEEPLTLREVANALPGGMSLQTLRRWIRVGLNDRQLPAFKIGRSLYTTWRDVLEFIEVM